MRHWATFSSSKFAYFYCVVESLLVGLFGSLRFETAEELFKSLDDRSEANAKALKDLFKDTK